MCAHRDPRLYIFPEIFRVSENIVAPLLVKKYGVHDPHNNAEFDNSHEYCDSKVEDRADDQHGAALEKEVVTVSSK